MDKKEKLKIDDQAQTIQGMKISDPDLYKRSALSCKIII